MIGTMLPMTITVTNVTAALRQAEGHQEGPDHVHAIVSAAAPSIRACARISMTFPQQPGTGPADWKERAYGLALEMLDPA